ncbi:MAG: sigma-70 family RNA polymerase sigma factor, partial [Humibacter sp.]
MSAHTAERRLSRAGDAELITLTRKGDSAAYATLFRRHASAAAAVARSVTSTFDPDDLVSEAYTRVLNALKSGNGPTAAFRPYLFTTVRNVAASWGRSSANTVALDPEEFEELELGTDDPLAAIDRSLTATAFRSLPPRWQEALWYSEVEGMTPARIAPLVGLSAQATAALCYRAREGLRQAWIRAHLTSPDLSPECSWTVDRLAARTRGRLGKREQSKVEAHLATCAKCTMVAEEAKDVGDRLALVLLPLAIGAAGATAYLATLHGGTAGVVAGAAGAGAVGAGTTASGTSASGAAGGSGGAAGASAGTATSAGGIFSGVTGIVVGSAAAIVVVGAAAVAGVAIFATPAAHSDTTSVDAGSASSPTASNGSTAQAPSRSSSTPTPSPSATSTVPAPLAARAVPPADSRSASTDPGASGGSGSSTNPRTPTTPSSPTAPSTPTGPSTPSGPGTSTPGDPGTPPTNPQPPAAPSIGTV